MARAAVAIEAEDSLDNPDDAVDQGPVMRCVTLMLADEVYGIDVMKVKEVLRFSEIAPVPSAPDYILGIMNLRGNVVTVIDGRRRMGLPEGGIDDATRIVIVNLESEVVGIVVDSVSNVVDIPLSAIDASPKASQSEGSRYIVGVVTYKGRLVIMVDLEMLIASGDHGY